MKFTPRKYQEECIKFIDDNPKSALFLDMGMGKSAIILSHITDMILDSLEIKNALIVAPLRVATVTWPAEINKWDHTGVLSYHVLHGKGRRVDAPKVNITTTNYETLPWLIQYPHIFSRFDYIVFDESTWLKNPSSKRWKLAFNMFGACKHIKLLTGTPIPNGLEDLWGQMFWLDHGARLGRTKSTFMQEYFMAGGYMNYKYVPLTGSLQRATDKIKDVAKTLKSEDYLQLPDRLVNEVPIVLPAKAMDIYNKFERDFFIELDGADILAPTAAAKATKLQQCVQGFMYDDIRNAHSIHRAKADALDELIKSKPYDNFLVATNFVHEIETLVSRFPGSSSIYGKTSASASKKCINEWNAGNVKLLFAHPASLSHGLNLQDGGNTIVWMGPTWNLEHWLQFNKRLHRPGQLKNVIIHILTALNTVDRVIARGLNSKDATQESLLNGLVRYQKGKKC